jgi:hypothetical protein
MATGRPILQSYQCKRSVIFDLCTQTWRFLQVFVDISNHIKGDEMKKSEIPMEYRTYLKKLMDEFADSDLPISKVIMADRLSSHFNLSPEYCIEIVFSLYN